MTDPGVARTRLYRDGKLALEDFPVGRISDELADPAAVVWLDLRQPTPEQLELCGEEFGLHELAVEDAVDTGQRPKLDRYDSHLFISAYWAKLDPERGTLGTSEIASSS